MIKAAEQTDSLVLGGGTGGYVATIRAVQRGPDVTIVEKYELGGICLRKGCIPTKALLGDAEVFDTLRQAASSGIETEVASIDFPRVQQWREEVIEQLHRGVEGLCKKDKIKISVGECAVLGSSIFSPVSGAVVVTLSDPIREEEIIAPKNVIAVAGSSPKALLNLPLNEEFTLSSDGILELEELPKPVTIIGGGVIGVEWASLLGSSGVNITIIGFLDRLPINESTTVSKELKKRLEQRGINILLGSKVQETKITGQKIQVEVVEQESLTVGKVMVVIKRQPNISRLRLQNTSTEYTDKGVKVDEFYQTTEGYTYTIGGCIDTLQLTYAAMEEEELTVQHLLGETTEPLNYTNVPRGVYTNPEIASVGYTRETLPVNKEVVIDTFNFNGNGKSLVYGETNGFVKITRDKRTDDLSGVSMIGPYVTDLIAEASTAVYLNIAPTEIGEAVYTHPVMTEVLREAALGTYDLAIHKQRKADENGNT